MKDVLIEQDGQYKEFEVYENKTKIFLGLFKGIDALMEAVELYHWNIL